MDKTCKRFLKILKKTEPDDEFGVYKYKTIQKLGILSDNEFYTVIDFLEAAGLIKRAYFKGSGSQ